MCLVRQFFSWEKIIKNNTANRGPRPVNLGFFPYYSVIPASWTWELSSGKVAGKVLIVDHIY